MEGAIATTEFESSVVETSFPGSSLLLPRESTLVAAGHVSMYTNQIRTGGGSLTYCVKTVYGGESCTLPHRRDPGRFPFDKNHRRYLKVKQVICQRFCLTVLRFYQNFYEYEILIEGSLLIFSTFLNNRQQSVSD